MAPLPDQPTRKYTVHPDDADLKRAADMINDANSRCLSAAPA